uniref:Uncharacterized protein n=1 Tax=Oryza glumipatula TaxID=40148 RepID=A0A0E0AVI6_9ORYZ
MGHKSHPAQSQPNSRARHVTLRTHQSTTSSSSSSAPRRPVAGRNHHHHSPSPPPPARAPPLPSPLPGRAARRISPLLPSRNPSQAGSV